MKLGEMLLEAGLVTEAQIEDAMSHDERRLGSALIARGVVAADVVARTLAQQHGLPAVELRLLEQRPAAVAALLPDLVGRRHCAVAIAVRGTGGARVLTVAMRDPSDLVALDELAFAAGMKIEARVAPELLLRTAIANAPAPPPPAAAEPPPAASVARPPSGPMAAMGARRPTPIPSTMPPRTTTPPSPALGGAAASARAAAGLGTGPPPTGSTMAPLPGQTPLTYLPVGTSMSDATTAGNMVASVIKFGFAAVIIIGVIFLATSYKKCITSTTRPVGAHYESRGLHLTIDFPDPAWRIAPGAGKKVDAKAEYFFRGGVPELPHVGMFIVRGQPGDVADAAQALAGDVVQDVRTLECKTSYARAGAFMCRGYGAVGLFGQRMQNAEVEVHVWRGTTDTIAAVMIKPDHTLSETEFILSSITDLQ